MPMPNPQELAAHSKEARDRRAAERAAAAAQERLSQEAENRREADRVLATVDDLVNKAADHGQTWVVIWRTQNCEHFWNPGDYGVCATPRELDPTSVAALILAGCIEKGYETRSFWNIVVDISGGKLPQYDDDQIDGQHYVHG